MSDWNRRLRLGIFVEFGVWLYEIFVAQSRKYTVSAGPQESGQRINFVTSQVEVLLQRW